jgi:hypothetical protein
MKRVEGILVIPEGYQKEKKVIEKAQGFIKKFETYEEKNKVPILLLLDVKSDAFYLVCHMDSKVLALKTDLEAVLDPEESEEYKLNRNLYTDNYAYKLMEADAKKGRSFEDLVIEYDTSYRPDRPLKVFGGQHRVLAIREAVKDKVLVNHGVRVYLGLSTEQRFEIASVNNTSIAVSNDLLDRMQEDVLGPELRKWFQRVGLLDQGQNFADRRSSEGIPTVRIARSIIVNFLRGRDGRLDEWHNPVVCSSGPGVDANYQAIREQIDWDDKKMLEMGRQLSLLHKTQREIVLNRKVDKYMEFANKALHPTVASGWAYATGLFQSNKSYLDAHYGIVQSTNAPADPLRAKELVKARLPGMDPETYRGLGSRISGDELGRMLQVFILQATKAQKRGINLKLANAAIQTFEALKQHMRAEKALKGI